MADEIQQVAAAADTSTIAGAMAFAVAAVRVLEHFTSVLVKKYRPPKEESKQVDSAVTDQLQAMSDKISRMSSVMERVDADGTPMVYSSRTGVEALREMILVIKSISQTQERLAKSLDRLDEKFEQHDRSDAMVFTQMASSIERMAKSLDDHDRRVMEEFRELRKSLKE